MKMINEGKMKKQERNLLRKLDNNAKHQWIIFIGLMFFLVIGYIHAAERIDRLLGIHGTNFSWVYQVDEIEHTNGNLVITGWAFELEKDTVGSNFEIVLRDVETEKFYFPKMTYEDREDVNEYFACDYNYIHSGFIATVPLSKLDLDGIYEIMLHPKSEREAYSANVYYADNRMQFVNPKTFVEPEVKGTDLESVVEEGILRVYQSEYKTYVYQYEGELYWITDGDANFKEDDWEVQFQMNTTQIYNLPQIRLENNWDWSNISFSFKKNELQEWNTGRYRVTKCAIPTEYSVTKIWTGNHVEKWIWIREFYPRYIFE